MNTTRSILINHEEEITLPILILMSSLIKELLLDFFISAAEYENDNQKIQGGPSPKQT